MMTRINRRAISMWAVGAIALAACGGDDDATTTSTTAALAAPVATTTAPPDTTAPATTVPVTTTPATAAPYTDLYTEQPADTPAPNATEPAPEGAVLELGETEFGPVLVAADGLTLYLFTPDTGGVPTCVGPCAGTWPPYIVDEGVELTAGAGLDAGLLSTVEHPDGGTMLVYGDWPLYYYAADQAPGDVEGQGVNDVWWVVDGSGAPTTG